MKIKREFYLRKNVEQVSRDLLGKVICTKTGNTITAGIIIETEAYGGGPDRASHANNNRRTTRTESMFLPGGHAYVYLCYGIHWMFNVVTGAENDPAAALIRAIHPLEGIPTMLKRRKMKRVEPRLSAGPGTLAQALGIDRRLDKADLLGEKIWIEDRGIKISKKDITVRPRVGVNYAGEDALRLRRYSITAFRPPF